MHESYRFKTSKLHQGDNMSEFVTTTEGAHIQCWAEFDQLFPGRKPSPNLVVLINRRDGDENR